MVKNENSVVVSGLLHLIRTDKKSGKYFPFAIRHEALWSDGSTRKDFLAARAFLPEVQEKVQALSEGTPIKVTGAMRSSRGSGELFIFVSEIQPL